MEWNIAHTECVNHVLMPHSEQTQNPCPITLHKKSERKKLAVSIIKDVQTEMIEMCS